MHKLQGESQYMLHLFKQGNPIVFECAVHKTIKYESRHGFINKTLSATCFGFVSHL